MIGQNQDLPDRFIIKLRDMSTYKYFRVILLTVAISLVMPAFSFLMSQEVVEAITDTTNKKPQTIPVAEISVRSGVVLVTTAKTLETVISEKQIAQKAKINDSVLLRVDSLLNLDRKSDLISRDIRYLNNKLMFWKRISKTVNDAKLELSNLVGDLEKKKFGIESEIVTWKNTKKALAEQDHTSSVFNRIDIVIAALDSSRNVLTERSDQVLTILDRTTAKAMQIDELINQIEKYISSNEEGVFVSHIPPLWKTDLSDPVNRSVVAPLRQLYDLEVKELISYLKNLQNKVIFQVFIIALLFIFFLFMKRRMAHLDYSEQSVYQRMLVKVLSHPVNAALILGLFSSLLIFPDRPLILRDLSKVVIMIPLVILSVLITSRKYSTYFYLLGVMMVVQTIYFFFPPGHLLYLASVLFIAITEFILLYKLISHLKKDNGSPSPRKRMFSVVVALHIGFSLTGIIALAFGVNILAEIAVNVTLINAFGGILLGISAFIVNGLIEVGLESRSARRLNVIRNYGREIAQRLTRLVNLGAVLFWFVTMLSVLRIRRSFFEGLSSFLTDELSIGSASFTMGGILTFFLVIWLSIVIANMIRAVLEEDVLSRMRLAKGLPHTISVMIRYTLITIGLLLAVSAAGMPLDSLTILFGAFGVGIGFGLQNIFNNLVSGLILLFERPIQIGDTIEVGQLMGNVKSIGIRSSNVRTFDGAEVIVPNGQLISNEVVNWTLSDQTRRIEVIAGVAYGSDPHKVKELFLQVLSDHPDIIKEPSPQVFFQELGDSSLNFRLLFWTNNFGEWVRIRSDIVFSVHDILKKEGIEIPFPQRDLHIRSLGQQIEIVRKEPKKEKE